MGTGLSGEFQSSSPGCAQDRERIRRRMVNYVYTRAKLARQFDHQLYGFVLGRPGPRSEKRFVSCRTDIPVGRKRKDTVVMRCRRFTKQWWTARNACPTYWPRNFRVNNQYGSQPRQFG